MADNIELDAGSGGAKIVTAQITFSGDTANVQGEFPGILSGSAESYVYTLIVGGAGAVTGGVQRMTLASDDPAVVALQVIDNAVSGAGFNITQFAGAAVPIGGGAEATALLVTIANDSTGTLTVDTTGTSGLEVVQVTAGDLNCTEASASAIKDAVEIMDDWDESNRAKVNLIAGQVGIAGGTGSDGATVPRFSLATDVPLPTGTNAIGKVSANSGVDSNNSTTTPLGGGATYTGTGSDLTGYSAVCITIYANVDSAASGMRFEFSSDDTNWDDSYTFTLNFSDSPTRRFQFPVTARYFRVRYTNGGGDQSAFRVQTILHTANQLTSIHRISDDVSPDRSAQIVKSALFAQKAGSGDLTLIDATASGNLKVAVEEFDTSLPAGTNNIGDVDVLSVLPGVAATNLGKAKGAVAGAVDVGVAPLAVRNDDLADLAGADADYTPLQVDLNGALYVNQGAAEPKSLAGIVAGGAEQDIIPLVGGKKILITALSITATSTTTNNVYLNNDDYDLWGSAANPIPMSMDADGDTIAGIMFPYNPAGWFKTNTVGEAVSITSSQAQDLAWSVSYIETD